jgi:hypothetical protein
MAQGLRGGVMKPKPDEPKVGDRYRHFKGNDYEVTGLVICGSVDIAEDESAVLSATPMPVLALGGTCYSFLLRDQDGYNRTYRRIKATGPIGAGEWAVVYRPIEPSTPPGMVKSFVQSAARFTGEVDLPNWGYSGPRFQKLLSWQSQPISRPKSDKEKLLDICHSLGLKRVDVEDADHTHPHSYEYRVSPRFVALPEGEGYYNFFVVFEFDADGRALKHSVLE